VIPVSLRMISATSASDIVTCPAPART
jgi:hypothetical protein